MKELANELTNNFHRRRTDRKLRYRIRQWWRDDVWLVKAFILNLFISAVIGGATGAIIVLAVHALGR